MLTIIKHHIVAKSCQIVLLFFCLNHFKVHVRVKVFFHSLLAPACIFHQCGRSLPLFRLLRWCLCVVNVMLLK